jgi:hypothetical protein
MVSYSLRMRHFNPSATVPTLTLLFCYRKGACKSKSCFLTNLALPRTKRGSLNNLCQTDSKFTSKMFNTRRQTGSQRLANLINQSIVKIHYISCCYENRICGSNNKRLAFNLTLIHLNLYKHRHKLFLYGPMKQENLMYDWGHQCGETSMKMAVFWDIAPCSLITVTVSTSETSVTLYQTTRRNIPEEYLPTGFSNCNGLCVSRCVLRVLPISTLELATLICEDYEYRCTICLDIFSQHRFSY